MSSYCYSLVIKLWNFSSICTEGLIIEIHLHTAPWGGRLKQRKLWEWKMKPNYHSHNQLRYMKLSGIFSLFWTTNNFLWPCIWRTLCWRYHCIISNYFCIYILIFHICFLTELFPDISNTALLTIKKKKKTHTLYNTHGFQINQTSL